MASTPNINYKTVSRYIHNKHKIFNKYLTKIYNKIPKYEIGECPFIPNKNPTSVTLNKNIRVNNKKEQIIEVRHFFINEHVTMHENGLTIKLKGGVNKSHTIFTGLSFSVKDNYVMMLKINDEFMDKANMNPVFVDRKTLMPPILHIVTNTVDPLTLKVDVVLFLIKTQNYMLDGVNDKTGCIKNVPIVTGKFQLSAIEERQDVLPYTVKTTGKTVWKLTKNTTLMIFPRKRNSKDIIIPLFGASVTNDSATLFNEEQVLDKSGDLSYIVVSGLYDKIKLQMFDTMNGEGGCNGGYNGWLYSLDPNYTRIVEMYKGNQKIINNVNKVLEILKGFPDLHYQYKSEDFAMASFNKKRLKSLEILQRKKSNTIDINEEIKKLVNNITTGLLYGEQHNSNIKAMEDFYKKDTNDKNEIYTSDESEEEDDDDDDDDFIDELDRGSDTDEIETTDIERLIKEEAKKWEEKQKQEEEEQIDSYFKSQEKRTLAEDELINDFVAKKRKEETVTDDVKEDKENDKLLI